MSSQNISDNNEDQIKSDNNVSPEDVYNILADQRRRYTIHYLKQKDDEQVSVQELAEQVAAWENNKSTKELDAQERKRVYISLYQSHLSTLDEEGFINYEKETGRVTLTDSIEKSDIYLEMVSGSNIPWSYFYLGLSIASGITILLRWMEIGITDELSFFFISIMMFMAFAVAATIHIVQSGRRKLGDSGSPPEVHYQDN